MSDWWYIIAVAGIALASLRYMQSRSTGKRSGGDPGRVSTPTQRDHTQERADARQAGMSDEDRAWEEASLQRDRATRERFGQAGGEPGSQLEHTYPAGAASGTDLAAGSGLSRE
jgi:hypothetical protein